MPQERAKRQSLSQRIGTLGEDLVRLWGHRNRLTMNKAADDVGVDFFSQVLAPIDERRDEVTGQFLTIQVKAVVNDGRRVVIDRVDAETMLRLEAPFCILAVDVRTETIGFMFLNLDLMRELSHFLATEQENYSWPFSEFDTDTANFRKAIRQFSAPSYQNQLRLQRARFEVARITSGGRLVVRQGTNGEFALVEANWITDLFQPDPDNQTEQADRFFSEGTLDFNIPLAPEIESLMRLFDGPLIVSGGLEARAQLIVFENGTNTNAITTYRRLGDERGHSTADGLIVVISDARERNGTYVHEVRSTVTRANAVPLGNPASSLPFLRKLRPGAMVGERFGGLLPIERFGLQFIGNDIEQLEGFCASSGIPLTEVYLADITQPQVQYALELHRHLSEGSPLNQFLPGFVLGPPASAELDEQLWKTCGFIVPIVGNCLGKGYTFWIEGSGHSYVYDGTIYGFRPRHANAWSIEVANQPHHVLGDSPELWLHADWPRISLSPNSALENITREGELPFAGDVWLT